MKTTLGMLLLLASAASAQDGPFETACTNATLHGTYGFSITGTRPSAPAPGSPVEMIVGVAITSFDGNGNFTQTDNIHGSITGLAAPDRKGTGTYTINPDCTGTMILNNPGAPTLTLSIVVVDDGNEVRAAVVNPTANVTAGAAAPQVIVSSNGRRVVTWLPFGREANRAQHTPATPETTQ